MVRENTIDIASGKLNQGIVFGGSGVMLDAFYGNLKYSGYI